MLLGDIWYHQPVKIHIVKRVIERSSEVLSMEICQTLNALPPSIAKAGATQAQVPNLFVDWK